MEIQDLNNLEGEQYMTLEEAIIYSAKRNDDLECAIGFKQLRGWLEELQKYIMRDTPQQVKRVTLMGRYICPACGKIMAVNVKNFCDNCGQAIEWGKFK